MKRIVFLSLLLACLGLLASPGQALIGVEDDSPGYDVLVPFFLVSMPGHGSKNTLIVITEVCRAAVSFQYSVFDSSSTIQGNGSWGTTQCGVIATDAATIVNRMSSDGRKALEIDLDGDGTNDHYFGYMVWLNANFSTPRNQVVAMIYQVDLLAGMAAATNIPAREVDESGSISDGKLIDLTRKTEYFSANALYRAQQYIEKKTVISDAKYLRLMPRYFLLDPHGKTYWFIWTDRPGSSLHIDWFDEEENSVSGNISLSSEANLIDLTSYVPVGLHGGYPKGGWANLSMPDLAGSGLDGDSEWVGYCYQSAVGTAQESYSVLTHIHKEAGATTAP